MRYYDSFEQYDGLPCAVMIGKFDGLHLGHRALISAMIAKETNLTKMILSFEMKGSKAEEILTEREKIALCEELGLNAFLHVDFDESIRNLSPEQFVTEYLYSSLNAKAVYVGGNFRFGKDRSGDTDMLQKLCQKYGIRVTVIPGVTIDGAPVSATEIRKKISSGSMQEASELLGSPYFISGTVVMGRQLGRVMRFPTLNLLPEQNKILPPNGVYRTMTYAKGRAIPSITNVGTKPSVTDEKTVVVETHLLDFPLSASLGYGSDIRVEFLSFIRPEQKFSGIEELCKQIERDIRVVKLEFDCES